MSTSPHRTGSLRPSLLLALVVAALVLPGCSRRERKEAGGDVVDGVITLAGQEWELESVGGSPAPRGAGGKAVTLRFDEANHRITGFGGCNQYEGGYTTAGETLTFVSPTTTLMACAEGMQVEGMWLRTLPLVRRAVIEGRSLVLHSQGGVLARLRPR